MGNTCSSDCCYDDNAKKEATKSVGAAPVTRTRYKASTSSSSDYFQEQKRKLKRHEAEKRIRKEEKEKEAEIEIADVLEAIFGERVDSSLREDLKKLQKPLLDLEAKFKQDLKVNKQEALKNYWTGLCNIDFEIKDSEYKEKVAKKIEQWISKWQQEYLDEQAVEEEKIEKSQKEEKEDLEENEESNSEPCARTPSHKSEKKPPGPKTEKKAKKPGRDLISPLTEYFKEQIQEEEEKEKQSLNKSPSLNYATLPVTGKLVGLYPQGECLLLSLDPEFSTELSVVDHPPNVHGTDRYFVVQLYFPQLDVLVDATVYFPGDCPNFRIEISGGVNKLPPSLSTKRMVHFLTFILCIHQEKLEKQKRQLNRIYRFKFTCSNDFFKQEQLVENQDKNHCQYDLQSKQKDFPFKNVQPQFVEKNDYLSSLGFENYVYVGFLECLLDYVGDVNKLELYYYSQFLAVLASKQYFCKSRPEEADEHLEQIARQIVVLTSRRNYQEIENLRRSLSGRDLARLEHKLNQMADQGTGEGRRPESIGGGVEGQKQPALGLEQIQGIIFGSSVYKHLGFDSKFNTFFDSDSSWQTFKLCGALEKNQALLEQFKGSACEAFGLDPALTFQVPRFKLHQSIDVCLVSYNGRKPKNLQVELGAIHKMLTDEKKEEEKKEEIKKEFREEFQKLGINYFDIRNLFKERYLNLNIDDYRITNLSQQIQENLSRISRNAGLDGHLRGVDPASYAFYDQEDLKLLEWLRDRRRYLQVLCADVSGAQNEGVIFVLAQKKVCQCGGTHDYKLHQDLQKLLDEEARFGKGVFVLPARLLKHQA